MSAHAYIAVRPGQDDPIHIVCVDCGLDQPADRWATAIDQTRAHNHDHHGEGAA